MLYSWLIPRSTIISISSNRINVTKYGYFTDCLFLAFCCYEGAYIFHSCHYFAHPLMWDDSTSYLDMLLVLAHCYRIYGFIFSSVAYLHCGTLRQNEQLELPFTMFILWSLGLMWSIIIKSQSRIWDFMLPCMCVKVYNWKHKQCFLPVLFFY